MWSAPVVRVAREFGLSDVALAKACRRRNVPLPPRGYWARRAAGQTVSRTPLPRALPLHERPVIFRAVRTSGPRAPRASAKSAPSAVLEKAALHPIADRLWKTLLLSQPRACGRVHIADGGLPLVVASPRQATKVAQFFHALIREAGRKQIDVNVARGLAQSLEFRRGQRSVQLNIEEEMLPRPGRAFRPSGRLTFQLAVQWKQAADMPTEEILENVVARMDDILR